MIKKKSFLKKKVFIVNKITILTVQSTSNNTIIHAQLPMNQNVVISAGTTGLGGARRSTVYAAQQTALHMGDKLRERHVKTAIIFFKGFGRGRKSIIKGLKKKKIKVLQLFDKTSNPHNGCRSSKKRRL